MKLLYLMMKCKDIKKDIVIQMVNSSSKYLNYKMILQYNSSGDVVLIDLDEHNISMSLCWLECEWLEIEILNQKYSYLKSNKLIDIK